MINSSGLYLEVIMSTGIVLIYIIYYYIDW